LNNIQSKGLNNWKDLVWWQSGEKQVVDERLADWKKKRIEYHPAKQDIYAALDATPYDQVRVCIVGQDPYPGGPPPWLSTTSARYATGLAFSIPKDIPQSNWPPTLTNIFQEYTADLHYPTPKHGDLSWWARNGVLMWNMYPTCESGKAGSHHWDEYTYLTKEIVLELDKKPIVFILLGQHARSLTKWITNSKVVETSHPSPLGVTKGFKGSRIFTTTNAHLCDLGLPTIPWRLTDGETKGITKYDQEGNLINRSL